MPVAVKLWKIFTADNCRQINVHETAARVFFTAFLNELKLECKPMPTVMAALRQ